MVESSALEPRDSPALEDLIFRCTDYYETVTGLPPGPAEAQSLFLAIPPHGDYSKKRLWGFFEGQRLVGVSDCAFDHPIKGHLWIGLLLFEPSHRGRGNGVVALDAIARHGLDGGAHTLSLAVKSTYMAAVRFWAGQGFYPVGQRDITMPGHGLTEFTLMDRAI